MLLKIVELLMGPVGKILLVGAIFAYGVYVGDRRADAYWQAQAEKSRAEAARIDQENRQRAEEAHQKDLAEFQRRAETAEKELAEYEEELANRPGGDRCVLTDADLDRLQQRYVPGGAPRPAEPGTGGAGPVHAPRPAPRR